MLEFETWKLYGVDFELAFRVHLYPSVVKIHV